MASTNGFDNWDALLYRHPATYGFDDQIDFIAPPMTASSRLLNTETDTDSFSGTE
jgi:hypothetical protein